MSGFQPLDPCPDNFTRIGESCYFFGATAGREYDWKAANRQCRKLNSVLAEFETIEENQDIIAYVQGNEYLKGEYLLFFLDLIPTEKLLLKN